jgi:hypothetical protein
MHGERHSQMTEMEWITLKPGAAFSAKRRALSRTSRERRLPDVNKSATVCTIHHWAPDPHKKGRIAGNHRRATFSMGLQRSESPRFACDTHAKYPPSQSRAMKKQ